MGLYFRYIGRHLSARGIHLYSSVENIDGAPQGKMMCNIPLSIHQYDNDIESYATKDDMRPGQA